MRELLKSCITGSAAAQATSTSCSPWADVVCVALWGRCWGGVHGAAGGLEMRVASTKASELLNPIVNGSTSREVTKSQFRFLLNGLKHSSDCCDFLVPHGLISYAPYGVD